MKKLLARTLMPVLLASALAGCKDPTPVEIVDMATKEFGVPVLYWAELNDVCATRQLMQFWSDYEGFPKKKRKAYVQKIRQRYTAIIMNATESLGDMTGQVRELILVDSNCGTNLKKCEKNVVKRKIVSDGRRTEEDYKPGTRYKQEDQAQIIPYSVNDLSTKAIFATRDEQFFDMVRANDDRDLDLGIRSGKAWQVVGAVKADPVNCGRIVNLWEIF